MTIQVVWIQISSTGHWYNSFVELVALLVNSFGESFVDLLLSVLARSLLLVLRPRVSTLRLDHAVKGSPGETSENFLGQGMVVGPAILGTVVFVGLCSFERDSTTKELMA